MQADQIAIKEQVIRYSTGGSTEDEKLLVEKWINKLLILSVVLFFSIFHDFPCIAQDVDFQSSNLPIVVIDMGGQDIPDEPKVAAHMGIIYNGEGNRNNLTDPFNEYDGAIGIELRGASSQTFPKKPYGIETRLADGENNNVSIFGMPEENDWILYAPYADKALIRNVLMYRLAADLGWYSPRTQFCELVLNGEYMGIYVFVEKIKKDKNRVNIPKPDSSDITGGYLCEMIVNSDLKDDETHFKLPQSKREIVVKYPKPEDITTEQHSYIADYFSEFETVLNSDLFNDPSEGYSKYIDMPSFIDFMLLSESSNQLDALSHSVFFYKNKNEKLCMGPGWDYNRCMGGARYYTSWSPSVWWLREPYGNNPELWYRINWAKRLMLDPDFMAAYSTRWFELRQTYFSYNYLYDLIDSYALILDEAKTRNFERWQVLGVSINNKYVFDTFDEEINYMKSWIEQKFTWLDEQFSTYETDALNCYLYNFSNQEEDPYNPAAYAVDKDGFTHWSAEFFPQWIEIDLKELKTIHKTVIQPYQERAYQYKIEAKKELSEAYSTIVDRLDNSEGGTDISDLFDPVDARFLKLTINGASGYSGDWVSIREFKVFGKTATVLSQETYSDDIYDIQSARVYPNPFNGSTTIYFHMRKTGSVRIDIYDLTGRKIATLLNEWRTIGLHEVRFDASQLNSGYYIFTINAGEKIETGKILLLE